MGFNITIEKPSDIERLSEDDLRKARAERGEVLHNIFEEAGEIPDPSRVKIIDVKDGRDLANQIKNRNDELTAIGERLTVFDEMTAAKRVADEIAREVKEGAKFKNDPSKFRPKDSGGSGQKDSPLLSLGEAFVKSDFLDMAKAKQNSGERPLPETSGYDFLMQKADFTTTAGWPPESTRTGRVVLSAQPEIEVTDILPVFPTQQAAIVYMQEGDFTNEAAERAEGGTYADATLTLTEQMQAVRSIGDRITVTDEQLADEPGVAPYLNQRLGYMVRQRLDTQILVGNGVAPNLRGTLNVAGINTQARGNDTTLDAIYKAMDLVRVQGRTAPSVAIIHPTDWQPVRLLKTADGVYIWGSPSDVGVARVWGLPVVLTTAVTENTAIVGDYARFSGLHPREELDIQVGYNSDDFIKGKVTIRAGVRTSVVHYRPKAFAEVTGL